MPGFTFDDPALRSDHRRRISLGFKNGIPVQRGAHEATPAPSTQPEDGPDLEELMRATRAVHMTRGGSASLLKATSASVEAPDAALEPVLLFTGYFEETVPDSPLEQNRVRHVKIYVYTKDDTIKVIEPATPNSGLPQGTLLKRQRVPKAHRADKFYSWTDFNVSQDMVLFGRTYRIYDCNRSTADYLHRNGIEVNAAEEAPADHYRTQRLNIDIPTTAAVAPAGIDKYKQFLTLDGKVLRFYCYWDDADSMPHVVERRHFVS